MLNDGTGVMQTAFTPVPLQTFTPLKIQIILFDLYIPSRNFYNFPTYNSPLRYCLIPDCSQDR